MLIGGLGSAGMPRWLAAPVSGLDIGLTANADLEAIAHIDEAGFTAGPGRRRFRCPRRIAVPRLAPDTFRHAHARGQAVVRRAFFGMTRR